MTETAATFTTYTVTANLPGYEGPWVLDVPTFGDPESACRRAMWALIAAGHFEPTGTPEQALELFSAEVAKP